VRPDGLTTDSHTWQARAEAISSEPTRVSSGEPSGCRFGLSTKIPAYSWPNVITNFAVTHQWRK
jgi:hypothetical protein